MYYSIFAHKKSVCSITCVLTGPLPKILCIMVYGKLSFDVYFNDLIPISDILKLICISEMRKNMLTVE